VETKKATDIYSYAGAEHDPGLMEFGAEVRDAKLLDEVRDTILSVAESIGGKGVSDEEVNRARQQILKARQRAEMDTSTFAIALSNGRRRATGDCISCIAIGSKR